MSSNPITTPTQVPTPPLVQVRPARPDDHAQWLPLWRGYQRFYEADIPEAVTEETWRRFHDPREPIDAALAELDGRIVGLVHMIEHRSCWSSANSIYLQDLFTDASVRGRGVGRALIAHVVATARARGCAKVHWLTHETNRQAMLLYDQVAERPGFVQYRVAL